MAHKRVNSIILLIVAFVLVSITLPYLLAWRASGSDYLFGGFLLNPIDGNSYLAKMYQGWRGDWRFTLPYSAEKGDGAYIFLFYIWLGHVARVFNLNLMFIFHMARILATLFMFLALFLFMKASFPDDTDPVFAFGLAACGAGLGWLVFPLGVFSSDFWVAETYPWLSAYANPHFPLSLGLVLLILLPGGDTHSDSKRKIYRNWPAAVASLCLAIVSPFGVVVVLAVIGGQAAWRYLFGKRRFELSSYDWRFLWVVIGGGPVLIYDFWVTYTDPLLSGWNIQNQTPSPPLWDLIVSLSPLILLGVFFTYQYARGSDKHTNWPAVPILLAWTWLGIALLYLPFGLQRRFMLGLYVPVAVLGVLGLRRLSILRSANPVRRYRTLAILLFLCVIPTNIVILLAASHGVRTRDQKLYLTRSEAQALAWLRSNSDQDALVLGGEDIGLFIPAHTGRRVIYGHPFETIRADDQKAFLEAFYGDQFSEDEMIEELNRRGVDFIFYGPREQVMGTPPMLAQFDQVFNAGDVSIYAFEPPQE